MQIYDDRTTLITILIVIIWVGFLSIPKKLKSYIKTERNSKKQIQKSKSKFHDTLPHPKCLECGNMPDFYRLDPRLNSLSFSKDKCTNLLTDGYWSDFVKCGMWERYHKWANGSTEIITDTHSDRWLTNNWWGRKEGYPCFDRKTAGCSHWPPYYNMSHIKVLIYSDIPISNMYIAIVS